VLPESLSRERRAPFRWRRANPLGALVLLRSHAELFGLSFVNFLGNLAHAVLPSISVLYMLYRYSWDESTVGLTLAAVGAASIIVQGGVVGSVTKWIGERAALLVGLAFGVVGFMVFALARTGVEFWLGIPLMAIWGLEGPACLALMSRFVGADEQGQLQGANASISGIANLFGPVLFTQIFAAAIAGGHEWHFSGAPFVLAALLLFFAAVTGWLVTRKRV
jgi:DHA1 family tetracycline resistance protein-like MFS transporter